jgi:hypothetical protein
MEPNHRLFAQFAQFRAFQAFMEQQLPIPNFPHRNQAMPPYQAPAYHPPAQYDPGMMLAMAQVKLPMLDGLKIDQIKSFRLSYRRYVAKCPAIDMVRPPGQFVLPEHLLAISTLNGIGDLDHLKHMAEEEFFMCLCSMHNTKMTSSYCRLLESVKMVTLNWSLELFLEYIDNFHFQLMVAGEECRPPDKELSKIFIRGIQSAALQLEIRRKGLETMEEIIQVTTEVIVRFRTISDLQESVPKVSSNHISKHNPKRVSRPMMDFVLPTPSSLPVVQPPRQLPSSNFDRRKEITCYKCLKKGHLAPTCPNQKHPQSSWQPRTARSMRKSDSADSSSETPTARSIRVFTTDIDQEKDVFIRLEVAILSPAMEEMIAPPQLKVSVFLDSGANLNSITREFLQSFIQPALLNDIKIESGKSFSVELAGGKSTVLSGESVILTLQVATVAGSVRFTERFFIFETCGEPISIGVNSIRSLLGNPGIAKEIFSPKIEDVSTPEELEFPSEVPLYPAEFSHSETSSTIDPTFPMFDQLKNIISKYSDILFASFDSKG